MKRLYVYGAISIISVFIRQFILPNPFECFGEQASIINWIAEPIIQVISYVLVGLVYKKGSNPAFGSFLFLLTYALFVGTLWLLGLFDFAWWWVLITIVVLISVLIGIWWLIERFSGDDYYN